MTSFHEKLEARAKHTLLCVGLDPSKSSGANEAKRECIALVDATAPYAAAFKPNAAFFEALGAGGFQALADVISHIKTSPHSSSIPVILDAKRGDIADTATAYATAAFDVLGACAITASPYMGADSLAPFLQRPDKGVFILCKTSNKGSDDLQSLTVVAKGGEDGNGKEAHEKKALFEVVAAKAEKTWSRGYPGMAGLVVGATDPNAIARVRAAAPSLWMLVPGVGAQGGSLELSLRAGLRPHDKSGMLINVSRGISRAKDPRAAAKEMSEQINAIRSSFSSSSSSFAAHNDGGSDGERETALANLLVASRCVRFGSFKLKSGKVSPIYIDLRNLVTFPTAMRAVAKEYASVIRSQYRYEDGSSSSSSSTRAAATRFDRIVGLPYAALPIAQAVSLEMNIPMIYPRREAKQYGTKAAIEGEYKPGERVLIIDDLVSTGETKVEAIEKLQAANLKVVGIVVLIDRDMGATDFFRAKGHKLHSCANVTRLLPLWKRSGVLSESQFEEVSAFLAKSKAGGSKL